MAQGPVVLEPSSPLAPEAAALITELNAYLDDLYHPDDNHFRLDAEEVSGGRGAFFLARLDGRPVGCGAIRVLVEGRAEVKRMYVRPDARGQGVGRAILDRLVEEAVGRGVHQLVLEMGDHQPDARSLYESFGFEPIPCFGEYLATPNSQCLGVTLT
jgi:putative acetyltransferase